jgi:hypothetical protein
MATEERVREEEFLKGRENYFTWLKYFKDYCIIEGFYSADSDAFVTTPATSVALMKKWLHKRIGNGPARKKFDPTKTIAQILLTLNTEFGSGYADPDVLIKAIKKEIYFDSRLDPQVVLSWLDDNLKSVNSALSATTPNQELADDEYRLIILEGLENVSEKTEFWKDPYGKIKRSKRNSETQTPLEIQKLLIDHWHDFSSPEVLLHQATSQQITPLRQVLRVPQVAARSSSNIASGSSFNANNAKGSRNRESCENCSKAENGRIKVCKSHKTSSCFYGDKPGWDKLNNASSNSAEGSVESGNKPLSQYSSLRFVYDTGATPKSFVTDMPNKFTHSKGIVSTANGSIIPTLGVGKIKFGNLEVDATYVPSFSKNLISGIDIMKRGVQTVIGNNKLIMASKIIVPENSVILATGRLDKATGLLMLDQDVDQNIVNDLQKENQKDEENNSQITHNLAGLTMNQVHRKLGHVGIEMAKRTIKNLNLKLESEKSNEICEPCIKGKLRKRNIPKSSSPREICEVIAGDEQGPFRIEGFNGTRYNVKFMDKSSGYLKMFNIKDIKSATLLDNFKPWVLRLEARTGKKVKYFMCDQSFDGPFLDFLEERGITKMKGEEYNYHHPGIVENANYNVTRHARSMLIDSKLPAKFYSEAQLCAAYLHNCTVHSGRTLTPREMCGQKKKPIKDLIPFGTHGYAFLKKEWRDKPTRLGKLEPVAVVCRMLGYADDDETEEMKGYKVLITHSWEGKPLLEPYIIYTNEVTFDENKEMEPLEMEVPFTDDDDLFESVNDNDGEFLNEPDLIEESDMSDTSSNDAFIGLSSTELSTMTNLVKETYGSWFDSSACCGLTPVELVYAMLALTDGIETPLTYEEAIKCTESKEWKVAMDKEVEKLAKFGTYDLVEKPAKNIVKCKWVYRKKLDLSGLVKEFKARLVAKGFSQRYGIDFFETFAPVAKMKSIRAIAAISASKGFLIYQDDAPSAFLNPDLKETVYMQQIPGYEDGSTRVCLLKKTIYGLKQSPREWNEVVHNFMIEQGFKQLEADNCVYVKHTSGSILIVAVYVDDILTCGKENSNELHEFRAALHKRFNMDKGGIIKHYLGMHFTFNKDGSISVDQKHYLEAKLKEFDTYIGTGSRSSPLPSNYSTEMENVKNEPIIPSSQFPYREIVGSLMYAMVSTMPSLAQPLSVVSRYLSKPTLTMCNLVRHICQYIRGNIDQNGILYSNKNSNLQIVGYVDAAYGNNTDCKSTSGFCFTLNGSIISWHSKRQPVTAFSTAESEYIAAAEAAKEAIWWRLFMEELGYPQSTTILFEDNEACILLSKNPQSHHRTKHIQIRFHFIREKVASSELELRYISTKDQLGDIFTKGSPGFHLRPILRKLGCGIKESGES